jgi:hypothetical protein
MRDGNISLNILKICISIRISAQVDRIFRKCRSEPAIEGKGHGKFGANSSSSGVEPESSSVAY